MIVAHFNVLFKNFSRGSLAKPRLPSVRYFCHVLNWVPRSERVWGMAVQLYTLLFSALDGGVCLDLHRGRFRPRGGVPRTYWTGAVRVPELVWALWKRNMSLFCREWNLCSSGRPFRGLASITKKDLDTVKQLMYIVMCIIVATCFDLISSSGQYYKTHRRIV